MKIKFNVDYELSLNKTIEIPSMTVVVRAVFLEKNILSTSFFRRMSVKKIGTKNHGCYYFDDIIKDIDINFSDILVDKKLYENISVYDILYKTSICPKPLCIRFDKIDGFIRVCGGEFRYIVLFDYELYDS